MIGQWYRAIDPDTFRCFIGLKILVNDKWFSLRGFELEHPLLNRGFELEHLLPKN